jgi:hypothetical protein
MPAGRSGRLRTPTPCRQRLPARQAPQCSQSLAQVRRCRVDLDHLVSAGRTGHQPEVSPGYAELSSHRAQCRLRGLAVDRPGRDPYQQRAGDRITVAAADRRPAGARPHPDRHPRRAHPPIVPPRRSAVVVAQAGAMGLRTGLKILTIAATVAAYVRVGRPWQLTWGATPDEVSRPLPGDDLVGRPTFNATRAISTPPGSGSSTPAPTAQPGWSPGSGRGFGGRPGPSPTRRWSRSRTSG